MNQNMTVCIFNTITLIRTFSLLRQVQATATTSTDRVTSSSCLGCRSAQSPTKWGSTRRNKTVYGTTTSIIFVVIITNCGTSCRRMSRRENIFLLPFLSFPITESFQRRSRFCVASGTRRKRCWSMFYFSRHSHHGNILSFSSPLVEHGASIRFCKFSIRLVIKLTSTKWLSPRRSRRGTNIVTRRWISKSTTTNRQAPAHEKFRTLPGKLNFNRNKLRSDTIHLQSRKLR